MNEKTRNIVTNRIERAQRTLKEARVLANSEYWNAYVNRLYYACFYAVSALLFQQGFSSSKHVGVRSLFNLHYVKLGKVPEYLGELYNTLFDWRHEGDYEDFVNFQESQVSPWLTQAEEFVQFISRLIQQE